LKDLPGPYIKWFLDKLGNDGLVKMLSPYEDKTGKAVTILAYAENDIDKPQLFIGITEGNIVKPRGATNFGWDPIFEPIDYNNKTYAEMTSDEKNFISHRGKAFQKMIDHFKAKK